MWTPVTLAKAEEDLASNPLGMAVRPKRSRPYGVTCLKPTAKNRHGVGGVASTHFQLARWVYSMHVYYLAVANVLSYLILGKCLMRLIPSSAPMFNRGHTEIVRNS